MKYLVGTVSYGTTGNKTLVLDDLDGATPFAVRVTVGARLNTTESSDFETKGFTDGTTTVCHSHAPSFAKKWPYSGQSNYLFALYTNSTTKAVSGTFVSWDVDELTINIDQANANHQICFEVWAQ